ncbi:META domain-containing protein [Psychroserpens algicola]|uniref:META domain-containing protein n=1 Tax=Psychroserpens algicola TaxID=1719034 RepID=UPI0019538B46|nr:META domain-containing protein [Psychroserpens algicola]
MKNIYFASLFLFSITTIFAQEDLLDGQWVMDSIFDHDIFLEDPSNPITIDFDVDANVITIQSFCGEIYQSFYTASTTENTFEITNAMWTPTTCSEDNSFEIATYGLLSIPTVHPQILIFTITNNGDSTSLVLDFAYFDEGLGVTTGVVANFTKENDPPEQLTTNWYLDQIVVDNVIHNNYFNESQNMGIIFTANPGSLANNLVFDGNSSCNSFDGNYVADENTISINSMAVTAMDCVGTPKQLYEDLYIEVLRVNNAIPSVLNYTAFGTGDAATLVISNPASGDYAVYGKIPSETTLVQTWYLSRMEIPGSSNIEIPFSDAPSLLFTNTIDPVLFETQALGNGDCNSFYCTYEFSFTSNGDNVLIRNFGATLADCTSSTYEDAYFATLESPSSNYFELKIINDGATLIMTDLLGAKLVFGDAPLSLEDVDIPTLDVVLKENLVSSVLKLSGLEPLQNPKYTIVTIQGKTIVGGPLLSDMILVDYLSSGVYFLNITTENNISKILKFIKR